MLPIFDKMEKCNDKTAEAYADQYESDTDSFIHEIVKHIDGNREKSIKLVNEAKDEILYTFIVRLTAFESYCVEHPTKTHTLDDLWQKGSVYVELHEVAKATGIPLVTLKHLDYETQQTIVYEFMMDSSQTNRMYQLTNSALAVMELDKVAKLISVPLRELRKLPTNMQERICSASDCSSPLCFGRSHAIENLQ